MTLEGFLTAVIHMKMSPCAKWHSGIGGPLGLLCNPFEITSINCSGIFSTEEIDCLVIYRRIVDE